MGKQKKSAKDIAFEKERCQYKETHRKWVRFIKKIYPIVDVTLVTTGVVRPVQDQFAVPVTNKATGEVLKLYFKQEKVENLKKSGFWETLEENASNGVELFVKVEKSGNNLLFLEKNEKAAG